MGRLFGTDGVRGIANTELTPELAMEIGKAVGTILCETCRRRPILVIGSDTRTSSDMLTCAVAAGVCSVGTDVINLGVIPTPAVAYLVGKYKADAGIMISASHNPSEFNGIKVFSGDGYKFPDMLEDWVEAIVLDKNTAIPNPVGDSLGKMTFATNAKKDYVDHIKSSVPYSLDGLNVAIDCANGASSETAKQLFSELGANVHIMHDHPDGANINDKCGSTHMESLAKYVVENSLDCGIAFDGDADRCLCVDEKGNIIDGDMIMAICALDLKERGKLSKNAVVGTVMTNLGFQKFCEQNDLKYVATKVGDRFVLEEMLLEEYSFGGEQSGHIIFRDFATTGDGQLTAAQLLSLIRRKNEKLSVLASVMTHYPQTTVNLKVSKEGKLLFYTDSDIKKAIDEAKEQLGTGGRIVVRPSGTEPLIRVMVEGLDEKMIKDIADGVAKTIKKKVGNK